MNIDLLQYIREGRDVLDPRCFHCGRCVEVCPHNVLSLGFRLGKGPKNPKPPAFLKRRQRPARGQQ